MTRPWGITDRAGNYLDNVTDLVEDISMKILKVSQYIMNAREDNSRIDMFKKVQKFMLKKRRR